MKKITTIGGGTGQYTLLRGLKDYDAELTAVVSMADDGGSTGRLRTEFGILAPGDLRNCLLALSNESDLEELVRFFNHRFPESGGELGKHNLGNLILTAAQQIYGSVEGIKRVAKMLGIHGKVLPISPNEMNLYGETDTGRILTGQVNVSYPKMQDKIKKIWLKPEAHIYKDVADSLRASETIVICPGDLYGSVLPNFLVKGVPEAIHESSAKIVYVCNLVTKQGTQGFKVSDFVGEVEKYCQKRLDYVICNSRKPSQKVVDKYHEEDSDFVEPDLNDKRAVKADLLLEHKSGNRTIARHNAETTSRMIMSLD